MKLFTAIRITDFLLSDGDFQRLAMVLGQSTVLEVLNVSQRSNQKVWIGPNRFRVLVSALRSSTSLTSLEANSYADKESKDVSLVPFCFEMMSDLVQHRLTSIDLGHNKLSNADADMILRAAGASRSMKILSLSYTYFGAEGLHSLPSTLAMSSTIEKLDFQWNDAFGTAGARLVADALKVSRSIKRINLGCCKIGDEGAIVVAAAISACPTLTELSLRYNGISDRGATALANALGGSHLISLDLRRNVIGWEGVGLLQEHARLGLAINLDDQQPPSQPPVHANVAPQSQMRGDNSASCCTIL